MIRATAKLKWLPVLLLACGWLAPRSARAYIEIPYSMARVINEASNIMVLQVEKVDTKNNLIIYKKISEIKGKDPHDTFKHNIGQRGFDKREWQNVMAWAEVGKIAVLFHNGGACETCIDGYWYQCYNGGDWWDMSHAEPFFNRSYCGRPEKLGPLVSAMIAGQEVVLPCMVDGDKMTLHLRTAKIQRLKASMKLVDYDAKRDFVGWGGEDIRNLAGMPGFGRFGAIGRVDPGVGGISIADFDGDGKPDICLFGIGHVSVLQNGGNMFAEAVLPLSGGARSAVWADYNGDGKPDLLLATPSGPKLFTNIGNGAFRDDSASLPQQPYWNLSSAAWIDYDGDGKPDILLADGYRGLRLYHNVISPAAVVSNEGPKLGKWHLFGPADSHGAQGFDKVYAPERGVDLKQTDEGKNGEKAVWTDRDFADGQINSLALFHPENNTDAVAYVYREIDVPGACDLPISLGSDDTLTVWLNGDKLLAENVSRGCTPDQNLLTLKLKPGKNKLLLKICQGSGDWAFYFMAGKPTTPSIAMFEDVSDSVGLGQGGIAGNVKGDQLAVADVDGDGRPDILFSAGSGVLMLNTPHGFVEARNSGLNYKAGGVTPVFADLFGNKTADLIVPQENGCKLYKNDGKGHFTDVTAASGALAQPVRGAACVTAVDFKHSGRLDVLVGCVGAPNRYFRNEGQGKFVDATEELGLEQKIFNTRAIQAVDLNKDGALDLVLNNEGQDSAVLLGKPSGKAQPAAGGPPAKGH